MHGEPVANPATEAPGEPTPPPRTERRLPRAALVVAGVAAIVLLLVVAGFVRLTGLVGAIHEVSAPPVFAASAPITDSADGRMAEQPSLNGANDGGSDEIGVAPDAGDAGPRVLEAATPGAGATPARGAGAGWLGGFADDAGQTLAGIASVAGVGDAQPEPLTILLMGVDARAGEPIDIGVRPDAMALLRLDPETGACRMLAVPRDTRAELPGYGLSKVNHALVVGGVPFQRQVVERLLRLEVDRFVLVDLRAVEEVVAILDGVTLDVAEAFVAADGTPIEAGEQTMDGRQVLAYVQYRGGADGDLGRIGRQQQVLRALLAKASGMEILPTVSRLLPVLEDHLRTDLSPAEIVALAQRFRGSCTPQTLSVAMLDGTIATFDDPLVHQPLSYLVIDEAEIVREREILLRGNGG